MANLTTLLYPVSAAVTGTVTANVGNVSDIVGAGYVHFAELLSNEPIFIARDNNNDLTDLKTDASKNLLISGPVTLEVNTNNCVLSSTGMPGVPSLSSRFTDSGIIMYINGASYNTETSYLQVRVGNNNFNNATLVMSKILPPNQNFEITIPYGIRGSPFHVIVCDSPVQPSLTDNQTFFSVNYKK